MKALILRLDDPLYARLVRKAKTDRRTITEQIRIALENHLAKAKPITR